MKFVSAVLATLATTSHAGGLRRQLEKEHKRLPPGFSPVPLPTPPAPAPTAVSPDPPAPQEACQASMAAGDDDYRETEYVALQYNATAENCLDLTDKAIQNMVAEAYYRAYAYLDGTCSQYGAVCEIYGAEMVAQVESSSTILLKLDTYCNSWKYFENDQKMCGVQIYNETVTEEQEVLFRNLQDNDNDCNCPRPTQARVVAAMNAALEQGIPCPAAESSADTPTPAPTPLAWVLATEQLCLTECHNATEAKDFTYNSDGVSAPCDIPKTTPKPSRRPTRRPTMRPSATPTMRPSATPTKEPTATPTSTDSPTDDTKTTLEPSTAVPVTTTAPTTAVPVTTIAPTTTDTTDTTLASTVSDASLVPTTGVTTPETGTPTLASQPPVTSETGTPTLATQPPVTPETGTPTLATQPPVTPETGTPTLATQPPVTPVTEAPVTPETEAPVTPQTEAPVMER